MGLDPESSLRGLQPATLIALPRGRTYDQAQKFWRVICIHPLRFGRNIRWNSAHRGGVHCRDHTPDQWKGHDHSFGWEECSDRL